jgi:hypothetical protein
MLTWWQHAEVGASNAPQENFYAETSNLIHLCHCYSDLPGSLQH